MTDIIISRGPPDQAAPIATQSTTSAGFTEGQFDHPPPLLPVGSSTLHIQSAEEIAAGSEPLLASAIATEQLLLFVHPICPYAQRSYLAAVFKGVSFQAIQIDLANKPAWFIHDINPAGQVPTLSDGRRHIRESLLVNEAIDELREEPALLPRDPFERAVVRRLINQFDSQVVGPLYRLLMRQDVTEQEQARTELIKALVAFEQEVSSLSTDGPWLLGHEFSLLDAASLPFLIRLDTVLRHYRDFTALGERDGDARLPILRRLLSHGVRDAGVLQTVYMPEGHASWDAYLVEAYRAYADGTRARQLQAAGKK